MKYFFLKEAVRTNETGDEYPQVLTMSEKHDYNDDNGVYAFSRKLLPDNNPNLRFLILDEKARLTDLLSTVMLRLQGFLMTHKLKAILSPLNLPVHKFYEAFVKTKSGTIHEYFWLQMLIDYDLSLVALPQSEFSSNGQVFMIHSKSQFDEKKETLKPARPKLSKIRLSQKYEENPVDIFKIPQFSIDWIVTSKLKDRLVEQQITGVNFTEISEDILR